MISLRERIIIERISSISDLSDTDKRLIEQDADLLGLIAENAILKALSNDFADAPEKNRFLTSVRFRASETKEKENKLMYFFRSLFSERKLHWHFAAAVLILFVFLGASVLLSANRSYAESNGVVFEIDFGNLPLDPEGGCDDAVLHETLKQLRVDIHNWIEASKQKSDSDAAEQSCQRKLILSVNVDNGHAVVRVGLLNEDSEKAVDLENHLKSKGYNILAVTDATWFLYGNDEATLDGITVSIGSRVFNFPMNASEADIEKTINEWFAVNKPEMQAEVDVTITNENGHKRVEIKIKLNETES